MIFVAERVDVCKEWGSPFLLIFAVMPCQCKKSESRRRVLSVSDTKLQESQNDHVKWFNWRVCP